MEHIIANSHKYRSIDEIHGDIDGIKETAQKKAKPLLQPSSAKDISGIKKTVQDKVDKELKYYEDAKVLEKFLENKQKQGKFGSTIIAEQYHGMVHTIIADKFKCFNSNIE